MHSGPQIGMHRLDEALPTRNVLMRYAIFGALLLGLALAITVLVWPKTRATTTTRITLPEPHAGPLPLPGDLLDISKDAALRANAERPADVTDHLAAKPFRSSDVGSALPNALECLTAAVYYEAATEPVDGQRAVAQVVLNRVSNRAFPHSVCAVVFQGAERATGCQFTFACDGALRRRPVPALWARARGIAAAALGGYVFAGVGHATHYHADYVLPRWAATLDKVSTIGAHIFYQWRGNWGEPMSFREPYAGTEPIGLFSAASARANHLPTEPVEDVSTTNPAIGETRYMVPQAIHAQPIAGPPPPGEAEPAGAQAQGKATDPGEAVPSKRWAIRQGCSSADSPTGCE